MLTQRHSANCPHCNAAGERKDPEKLFSEDFVCEQGHDYKVVTDVAAMRIGAHKLHFKTMTVQLELSADGPEMDR